MGEIDPITGLPKELAAFEEIAKDDQVIKIYTQKQKFGKYYTVVEGLDKSIDIKKLSKQLKGKLACGGTTKDKRIELQGNHKNQVKRLLEAEGFDPDTISIQ